MLQQPAPEAPLAVRAVTLALVILLLFPGMLAADARKGVLIVFDEDKDFPGLAMLNRSLRETLSSELKSDVEFYSESLNLSQFGAKDYDGVLRDYFQRKYAGARVDLIVAVLGPSLDFLLRHGAALFPGIPIVFCGVDPSELKGRTLGKNVTGVLVKRTFAPTLDTALQLQPDTQNVFVVGGTSQFDRQVQAIARREFTPFEGRVAITYLTELPMLDLLTTLSALPPHSVVLYLTLLADGIGRAFIPHEALSLITGAANAPVYVSVDQYLGSGTVGGHVYSLAAHGRQAAEIGLQILRGATPASIRVVEPLAHRYMFDWRQLQRWGLREGRLPAGSQIVFRQPTLWREYRWYVVGAVGLLGAQAALIVTLLTQRRRRRQAQALIGDVLAALPGEAAIIDPAGTIVQTNDAWATAARNVAGAQPAFNVGANYLEACRNATDMPLDVAQKVHASIESILRGEREEFALEYPTFRYGETRWFEVRTCRLRHLGQGAAVMHFDVTARRQAEAAAHRHLGQIAHLDRVAGMAQLASSLAHELNQPLTSILSNAFAAERLLSSVRPDLADVRACLADIISADERAAEVIRRMRRLLKKANVVTSPLALNDLVAATIGLVSNVALLHNVSVEFMPAPVLPVAYGDPVQIQQVILNLLTNAISATSDAATARKVVVWTVAVEPYIEISVHDSGPGIKEGDLERLFEPFFSSKEEGLGMGLAISRAIVEAHGGRLVGGNDPGGGATFRVYLRTDQASTTMVHMSPLLDRLGSA